MKAPLVYVSILWLGISSLLGCLLSLIAGQLLPWISVSSLIAGFGLAVFLGRKSTLNFKMPRVSIPVGLLYTVIVIGIYFHSVFLFYKRDGNYWIQNPFNLGDMSFHWGTIRYLAKGAHFWPENPIFMGHRFRYPFGMDFFNAFFENLHIPMATHLPLVTLVCLLLILAMLHLTGGPLLVFGIFFSGGFFNIWQRGTWDLTQIQSGLDFKNLFLAVLLTQRGFLYALPATLLVFWALKNFFAKKWLPNTYEKVALGLVWGSLGFFHLHTYFFASLLLGCWILWQKHLRAWLLTVVTAAVIGAPFVLNAVWPEAGVGSLMHWSRGWARPENRDVFSYWLQNMGPWLGAMVWGLIYFYRKKSWEMVIPLAFIGGLFLLFAHLILAPWDWDNIKLLLWCYLFGLLWLSGFLWSSRGSVFKILVFAVFFLPGTLLFVQSLPIYNHGISWVSERELNKAEILLAGHDVNLGMAIAPEYEHTALLLGHKLYMGYTGHVWSHGYNYVARETLLSRYFTGDTSVIPELQAEKVQLMYQGPLERRRETGWQAPPGLFKLGQALDHELYKIESK